MFTHFMRALRFAITDFMRNKGISAAAIFVLIVTTLPVTGLFFLQGMSSFLVSAIENKIDITAYFKQDAAEQDILAVKTDLLKQIPAIKRIEYVSQDQALQDFTQTHADDPVLAKALTEVGGNPFSPSLNIVTNGNPAQYAQVAAFLQGDKYSGILDKVDFSQKKDTIEKVFSITSGLTAFGVAMGLVLVLVAMLIVFNVLKLVIDRGKEEINTMRIVGASSWFIKAPFILQSILFGLISLAFCFTVTAALAYFLSPATDSLMPGFSLFGYFLANWWIIVLIQLIFGAGLASLSSWLAVRKYLKV